jgi:hypothetical protein
MKYLLRCGSCKLKALDLWLGLFARAKHTIDEFCGLTEESSL